MSWRAPDLSGRVAVVTGASRGVGRGIAIVLGGCGATVYVTGRTTRAGGAMTIPPAPGTVEDVAEAVTKAAGTTGGRGVAAPTDHTDDTQVAALFERVAAEQDGALDLLVANAWGGYERHGEDFTAPFWAQPLWRRDAMFTAGLRAQFTAARVAAVGVYPAFTRTEAIVAAFAAQGTEPPPETHSPEFVGRVVASLLDDSGVMAFSGTGAQAAVHARRYGVTDVDGRAVLPFALPDEYGLSAS